MRAKTKHISTPLLCYLPPHTVRFWAPSEDACRAGDVAKAFGAGADFVMLGGMLAGHDESGGEVVERYGRKFKVFYGMSSTTAMSKHAVGVGDCVGDGVLPFLRLSLAFLSCPS